MGYHRIQGELVGLGHTVAASSVWKIMEDAGLDPAPRQSGPTWRHDVDMVSGTHRSGGTARLGQR
jgi:hypothetical protein